MVLLAGVMLLAGPKPARPKGPDRLSEAVIPGF
jgi:hypothetical protein